MSASRRPAPKPATSKRRQTVQRLVDAANAVIAEKGFQRASLDEIAGQAGLTKGAIYSNFDSKEHLFLAVVRSRRLTVAFEGSLDQPIRALLRRNAEAFSANLKQARAHSAFLAEFILYALTHEEVRQRWADSYTEQFADASPQTEAYLKAEGQPPFRVFSMTLNALAFGLYIQHAITPQLVTDEAIIAAFEALAGPAEP